MGDDGIVAGSAVAVGLTIFMCVCGVPMIFAGAIMIAIYNNTEPYNQPDVEVIYIVGIVLVAVSGLLLVAGIVLIVLLCVGVCGPTNNRTAPVHHPQTGMVIVSQQHGYPPGGGVTHQPQAYPPPGAGPSNPGYYPPPPAPTADQTYMYEGGTNPAEPPKPAHASPPPGYNDTNYKTQY